MRPPFCQWKVDGQHGLGGSHCSTQVNKVMAMSATPLAAQFRNMALIGVPGSSI